ncbi:protein YtfP [Porphyridium purpureum]|uniref:Protein YtfP n=1 Tax=Porphyridium purpureum TaxID=35688 RepID=A0A5J4YWB9_PORPP|nr:protein YtfP [Porphyridium purpureum]|eukprot:POR4037..scf227_4
MCGVPAAVVMGGQVHVRSTARMRPGRETKDGMPNALAFAISMLETPSASERPRRVAVVGGGAAGFFAAIQAATCARNAKRDLQVSIFEANASVLGKVAISGGGRCNVTHAAFDPAVLAEGYPRGRRELLGPFETTFNARDTVNWFEQHGVPLKIEEDGRIFPVSDSSQSIIDALVRTAQSLKVQVHCSCPVQHIQVLDGQAQGRFLLKLRRRLAQQDSNDEQMFDQVLVAAGSNRQVMRWMHELGHEISAPVPSLFTFASKDSLLQGLAGVSIEAQVSLVLPEEVKKGSRKASARAFGLVQRGPVLITHVGLSGPAILRLSAFGARLIHDLTYKFDIAVDFLPSSESTMTLAAIETAKVRYANKIVRSFCPLRTDPLAQTTNDGSGLLKSSPSIPKRLWQALVVSTLGTSRETIKWSELSKAECERLCRTLHGYVLCLACSLPERSWTSMALREVGTSRTHGLQATLPAKTSASLDNRHPESPSFISIACAFRSDVSKRCSWFICRSQVGGADGHRTTPAFKPTALAKRRCMGKGESQSFRCLSSFE